MRATDPRNDPRRVAQRLARRGSPTSSTRGPTTARSYPPRSVVDAARELTRPELRRSLAFRCAAYGRHEYSLVRAELLEWKRGFEKELSRSEFPLYCLELGADFASYVHFTRLYDLRRCEWSVIYHLGAEVARRLGVEMVWGGHCEVFHPAFWLLGPDAARAEFL